jgi:hypothetical protein
VAAVRKVAMAIDVVSVLVFVAIGRHAHAHGESVGGVVSTAWPFAVGLIAGWVAVAVIHRGPTPVRPGGIVVWLSTVAVGMILRVIAGQGTAVAFIIVALCFLGATMLGGRAMAGLVRRQTAPVASE